MNFEPVKRCPDAQLPQRATAASAGYDFFCYEDTIIPPYEIVLIPTGVKCKLDSGYWLMLAVRSSTPRKKHLILANGIGIIDSDYYGNPDNDGEIMFQVYNFSNSPVEVKKGERIGQGVCLPYSLTNDDTAEGLRQGGFGSTDDIGSLFCKIILDK